MTSAASHLSAKHPATGLHLSRTTTDLVRKAVESTLSEIRLEPQDLEALVLERGHLWLGGE